MASNERVGITLDVLPGTFAGITAALGGFNELVAATSQFSSAIAKSTSIVDSMTLTLGVALAGAAWESAKAFGELERGMKIVQAVSGQTSSEISVLTQKAGELSIKYKLGIDDITDGLQTLGRAGLSNVNTQLDTMQAGLQAAKIEGIALNDALEMIISTTSLLGGDIQSANFGKQADKLTTQLLSTSMSAPIDVNDVVQTLSYSGGTAAAAGINIQNDDALYDYLGAISAFAQKGVKGSMAGTAMRAFFTKPASQDKSVTDALSRLDMKASDLWEPGGDAMRPVSEQIELIHNQMDKLHMSTLDQIELWGKIVGPKMGQQMMKLDESTIKQASREIRETSSATEMTNIAMDNFLSDLSTLEQQAQRSWRSYGEAALAWIGPIVKGLSAVYEIIGNINPLGVPFFQQFVKLGIIVVISQVIQKLGAVKDLFKGIGQEIYNMVTSMSQSEQAVEETAEAERKRLQALGLSEDQAKTLANTEDTVTKNIGASNKVLAEFLVKLNEAVSLMSELATLSRTASMSNISSISSAQHDRAFMKDGTKGMLKTAWFDGMSGGDLTRNEFATLALRHGMNVEGKGGLLDIYRSSGFQTFWRENQSEKSTFATAISLEKYLQENRKGLYDSKTNPIMGIVNNIKTDTGLIAQGVRTPNSSQKPPIDSLSDFKSQEDINSINRTKKEQEQKESEVTAEKEKQKQQEKNVTTEKEKQAQKEKNVTAEKEKQFNASWSSAEKIITQQKISENAWERINQVLSNGVLPEENTTTIEALRLNQVLKGTEEAQQRISSQKTIELNETIQATDTLRRLHQIHANGERNIGTNINERYILTEEQNRLTSEYNLLLQENINRIKGTNTSAGYTGSFTNRNIKRRNGTYMYDEENVDETALKQNQQAINRYQSYQDQVEKGQIKDVVQQHLSVEKQLLAEVEAELVNARQKKIQNESILNQTKRELAEVNETITLYEENKDLLRAITANNLRNLSNNVTGNSSNDARNILRGQTLGDMYKTNLQAQESLINSVARQEAEVKQKNLGVDKKILYLETQRELLLQNINQLEKTQDLANKESVSQAELEVIRLNEGVNTLVARNEFLTQERNIAQQNVTKGFEYSASQQNAINASMLAPGLHLTQNNLLTSINKEYETFLANKRASINRVNSLDKQIESNEEQINLALAALAEKLNALSGSVMLGSPNSTRNGIFNPKTSAIPGVGATMPFNTSPISDYWNKTTSASMKAPLALPPGQQLLLLPEQAESLKSTGFIITNPSELWSKAPNKFAKESIHYGTENYVPSMSSRYGTLVGDSYGTTAYNPKKINDMLGIPNKPVLQLEQTAKTFQTSSETYNKATQIGRDFWASMRTGYFAGNPRSADLQGQGKFWNWMQMGMTGMVNWNSVRQSGEGLSRLGKVANVAGGALGSVMSMLGPVEVGMFGLSLVMQGVQIAQQKYKEELEKINSELSEARENFDKAEEAFLGAYEEQNPNATQEQKDEALLNLYANGPGDRGDGLDSYRARVFGTLSQIEVNTRKKAEKENDFFWGSQGGIQKHFWSPWDEFWGGVFDNPKGIIRDEYNEQIAQARQTAVVNGQNPNIPGNTGYNITNAEQIEQQYHKLFHLEELDQTLNHYENWVDDLEDYSDQAKYVTSIMSQGVDKTGPTNDSSWLRTFQYYSQEQIQAGIWGSKNGINDYRRFEQSLSRLPDTIKTQIGNSINQDPDFYKSMQRQMFTFRDGRLQRIEGRETKILEAIRRRVGNITTEQAKQTLILSTISSINDFVQNQVQPAVLANVDAAMQGTQILGLTNTSVGYTGNSTAAVHQYVMVITSQLGQIVKQRALDSANLLAEASGIKFEDLTKLAREGENAQGLSKAYDAEDAKQARQVWDSVGQALYAGPMMTKGMSQEQAYEYAQNKFKELNTPDSTLSMMLGTWDRWFGGTMAPYIEQEWAKGLQDTGAEATGAETTDEDSSSDKKSSADKSNRKNWVNLAICNKKEIPKLNVNLFKKPPNFTILNRNLKLRDVNVNTADDAKSIQNAVKNSIIEIQNRSNPKIIQDDAAEYDPVNATEGNNLPVGTKRTE